MNYSVVVLILTGAVFTSGDFPEMHLVYGCDNSGDPQLYVALDWEQVFYVDVMKGEIVWTIPNTTPPPMLTYLYKFAPVMSEACRSWRVWGETTHSNEADAKEAPVSSIYARDAIEQGVGNTLICFVDHFYPPYVKVSWTKNDMEVTKRASFHPYYPNKDGTFHQFYSLSFTPEEGDVYTCTVEHVALEDPQTRTWENKVDEVGVGPAVLCAVGLSLGLLGVALGTFILFRKPQ